MGDYFSRNGALPYSPPPLAVAASGGNRSSQGNGLTPTSSGITTPNPFLGLTPQQRVGATQAASKTAGFDPTNPASAISNLAFNGAPAAQGYNNAGGTFSLMA
jgi:hypothetical protein